MGEEPVPLQAVDDNSDVDDNWRSIHGPHHEPEEGLGSKILGCLIGILLLPVMLLGTAVEGVFSLIPVLIVLLLVNWFSGGVLLNWLRKLLGCP